MLAKRGYSGNVTTSAVLALWWLTINNKVLCGHCILLPLDVWAEGVTRATESMVFYTRAHDVVAEEGYLPHGVPVV